MKRILALLLCLSLLTAAVPLCLAVREDDLAAAAEGSGLGPDGPAESGPAVPAPSVILIERDSGTVLTEKNADQRLSPASVTKVMTLLLVMEAIAAGQITKEDNVTISQASMRMGGSTAYLAEGERYTVHEMIKATAIQSANDAAVALAEFLAGSEDSFVTRMNARAQELGMTNTQFKNCHGLDEEGHYASARDIALMSRQLLMHKDIRDYTTVWMDSLRDGTFMLANTNRLVRFYEGATGLKTGSTSKAGCCISASAERGGMELIAVVMKASSSDDRFESARALLDFGFATYTTVKAYPEAVPAPIPVLLGEQKEVQPVVGLEQVVVVEKSAVKSVQRETTLPAEVKAPVQAGQTLGELKLTLNGQTLATVPLVAATEVRKLTFGVVLGRMLKLLMLG